MGALEAVLQMKAQERAQEESNGQAFANALQIFNTARQQALSNSLAIKQYKAGLAEKGLVEDANSPNGFKRDISLMSPLEQLIEAGKAADANNKIIEAGGQGINLFSNKSSPNFINIPQVGGAIGQTINQPSINSGQGIVSGQTLNVAGVPTSTKLEYPAADAAKASATDMAKEQTAAQTTSARDTAQFQMVAQGIKNLNEIHKNLVDKGFAGDMYRGAFSENLDKIPLEIQKNVPKDVQKDIGKFVSGRNEILVKVQPILSQQFGQAGSVRIMESLVNLSKQEFGGLGTPRAQFEGQAEGTLSSLYRIKLASDRYIQELQKAGQEIPKDENSVIQGIAANMSDLSPEQDKQLQGLVKNTLGYSKSFNSIKEAESSGLPKGTIVTINGRKARID